LLFIYIFTKITSLFNSKQGEFLMSLPVTTEKNLQASASEKSQDNVKNELISKIDALQQQIIPATKELLCAVNLYRFVATPSLFPASADYDQLRAKLSLQAPQNTQGIHLIVIDTIVQLRGNLKWMAESYEWTLSPLMTSLNLWCMATPPHLHARLMSRHISTMENLCQKLTEARLDNAAQLFSTLTQEDWQKIQQVFEKNKMVFSPDFVQRCQRVALKTIAA
jgi:hypothetical protein